MSPVPFDAIVIAPASDDVKVCGLTLAERARRVALKAGAVRVHVTRADTPDQLAAWAAAQPDHELVVLDATDHVVHVPLVQILRVGGDNLAISPTDGSFAGAIVAAPEQRLDLARAATSPAALATLAQAWRTRGVPTHAYGDLARAPARTSAEQRAAVHFLFGLIRKAQDTWLVRTINRKVSYPFTRLLLPITALTPNIISICVFIFGAIGCFIIAFAGATPTYEATVIGASMLLFAGYLDGCDGEVARIRLESSKLGAWIDTIADELTTILSVTCFGIHVYRKYPYPWLLAIVVIAAVLSTVAVGSIYYYLLTSGTTGNSQDYPVTNPIVKFLGYFIRREVINLATFIICLVGGVDILYIGLALGALVSSSILLTQQLIRGAQKRRATHLDAAASS
ncbi:MAG: CDP-alcohol phosphatidyltransferase family protein [Proteobacteria bacterium]|nr:CDP-alcohol phosphatidyltransferase family protein [Pseudomonadota bacterium]